VIGVGNRDKKNKKVKEIGNFDGLKGRILEFENAGGNAQCQFHRTIRYEKGAIFESRYGSKLRQVILGRMIPQPLLCGSTKK
jgi:hypothetical protein